VEILDFKNNANRYFYIFFEISNKISLEITRTKILKCFLIIDFFVAKHKNILFSGKIEVNFVRLLPTVMETCFQVLPLSLHSSSSLVFVVKHSGKVPPVNNIPRMISRCLPFHQSVFAILFVQVKSSVNQNGSGSNAETNANPLTDARHVYYREDDKYGKQPAGEQKQILTFQALKFG
jgi:hypothetical protein